MNSGDCSGFIKSVQSKLRIPPFVGDANGIADEVYGTTDWTVLGVGSKAAVSSGDAAEADRFVVAVWKAPPGHHGHVAIITARLPLLGNRPEQQTIGAWGQLNGDGSLLGKMSQLFGAAKRPRIIYAVYNPIIMPRFV